MVGYFCVCMMPFLLAVGRMPCNRALTVVSKRAFWLRCLCMCTQRNLFCLIFSKKFNIMSAVFANNLQPCRKKSILEKVRFDAKWG